MQPLVGDIGGGWNMSWYRDTFAAKSFVAAAAKEIKDGGLEGLNFDYEPHQPGTKTDAKAYASMVDGIATASGSAMMTIDFPCDGDLCDKATLVAGLKTGGKFME